MSKLSGEILFVFSVALLCMSGCRSTSNIKGQKVMNYTYEHHVDVHSTDILTKCREQLVSARDFRDQLIRANKDDDEKPFLDILNLYNEILIRVDAALSKASLFSQVHPDEKVRKEAETCEQEASSFVSELYLNRDVYEALRVGNEQNLPPDAHRLLTHAIRDFRRSGVDKDEATRAGIKALRDELVAIGQEFGENIRKDRFVIKLDNESMMAGLPKDYIDAHKKGPDGKIDISTDYPDYIPFMTYAQSDKLRKELRFKYLNRGEKNGPILQKMIEKRNELAKILNYGSYADYVVEDKMIKRASAISEFIKKITQIAKAGADKEYAALLSFKQKHDKKATFIAGYESAYLEEAFKKEKFGFDSQAVRPYFPYNQVRDGLLQVTSKLFDIHYKPVTDAQVWHSSVATYDVFDENGKLGRIYLDMHPRDGKYKHAAQFTVRSGLENRQYPEGALVCNFPDPSTGDGLALMEHPQVVTMFHEFGHLLHHIFAGKQKWIPFSGVATEWDFVEAPSQFLEEWAWSPEVLQLFGHHYQTGQPIPTDLVNKMRAAEEFGKAIAARQQMFYAALSLSYFGDDPKSFDMLDRLKELQKEYSYFPYEPGTHFHYSFGHLEGYSAMYYTYMWSLSIAKDLLEPFKKEGLMNPPLAKRFKDTILKPGGSKDASDLVIDFLGRPFKFDAFERWLSADPLAMNPS